LGLFATVAEKFSELGKKFNSFLLISQPQRKKQQLHEIKYFSEPFIPRLETLSK
jgi:hypothetical protein